MFSIGGNLFSSFWNSANSVGASTSDFGILTGLLSMIFVNWNAFKGQQLEQTRCILLFMVILMIIMNLLAGAGAKSNSDTLGHCGGGIAGLVWGFAFFPRVKDDLSAKLRKCGLISSVVFFLLFAILLFTTNENKIVCPDHIDAKCSF